MYVLLQTFRLTNTKLIFGIEKSRFYRSEVSSVGMDIMG